MQLPAIETGPTQIRYPFLRYIPHAKSSHMVEINTPSSCIVDPTKAYSSPARKEEKQPYGRIQCPNKNPNAGI